jgi:hypothetical protein
LCAEVTSGREEEETTKVLKIKCRWLIIIVVIEKTEVGRTRKF